ncbi:MAG: major capsid protein [Microviridae sp.]|nr:MAG: major capsid protein [Microviridae sp.]
MQKTLGGDRLGSGKKMQVNLHNYGRSTHDLGYLWRSTMSAGTLVPFLCEVALPGDTWDIKLDSDIKTHPTVGPLFGSYKWQYDVFLCPIRLYNSLMHNNMLGIGMDMSKVLLPVVELTGRPIPTGDPDNAQINPSALLSYLGIRGVGNVTSGTADRQFNGVPLLCYWEIYKNYYSNKQEEIGALINAEVTGNTGNLYSLNLIRGGSTVISIPPYPTVAIGEVVQLDDVILIEYTGSTPVALELINVNYLLGGPNTAALSNMLFNINYSVPGEIRGTINYDLAGMVMENYSATNQAVTVKPRVETFDLNDIDDMRKAILAYSSESVPFEVNKAGISPYQFTGSTTSGTPRELFSQQGLGLKTYQSDMFNNWLETTWVENVANASAVSTAGDSFNIDSLILANKVYNLLNRIMVSGGSYDDWLDAVWAGDRVRRSESPMYMGGMSKELVFQEVISNTETQTQPLGTLGGRGVMSNKKKGGTIVINVDEPSYIIGIVSGTPRIDYSQGNKWDVNLKTMNDLHKPELDGIGFQDLITEQMAWWDTTWDGSKWVQKSAGKQPAWLNYMTNVNQTRGNFAITSNEMFMTLNRRYEREAGTIKDLTTYIDPSKFNFIFADTSLDSQNFWVQISVNAEVRRKMSAKVMPNL